MIAQLLTESFLLSLLATGVGVMLGWAMLRTIVAVASSKLPRLHRCQPTSAADDVKQQGQQAASDVRDSASESAASVKDQAQS